MLQKGMVLTVEPGLYFNEAWIAHELKVNAHKARFVNVDVLPRFYPLGGVRLEDDVLVTADGFENMSACLPVEIEDIEAIIREARTTGS
jgi:Xaa-Pro dipeptidase